MCVRKREREGGEKSETGNEMCSSKINLLIICFWLHLFVFKELCFQYLRELS